MKKISRAIAVIFILIATYTFFKAGSFPPAATGAPGPGYFPRILSIIVFILSVIELFNSRRTSNDEEVNVGVKLFSKENSRVWISLLILVLYFIGLATVGFVLSTIMYLFIMLSYFKVENKIVKIAVPLILTSGLFFIFTVLLKVQLPSGML